MKLEDYTRYVEQINQRLTDPSRRKLHIQYAGKSEHGGCHVTVFVMGTWFQHIHISDEALKTPDLFAYTIETSLRAAVGVLIEEAVKLEAPRLREDLDRTMEESNAESKKD